MPQAVSFRPISDFSRSSLPIRSFDCGNDEMNKYLKQGMAHKNNKSGLSPCLVLVPQGKNEPILGYVTVSNSTVEKGEPPAPPLASFPDYPIPVTLIGKLAISKDHQRQELGKRALMHVFFTSARAIRELKIGSVGIITDAIDQEAVDFYSKFDFQILPDQDSFPKRMFIPNHTFFDAIDV